MNHDIVIEGFMYRLRPICDADAPFIIELRTNNHRSRYLHKVSGLLDDQLRWLEDYYNRSGDYYFLLERMDNNDREGLISIYDIDNNKMTAEIGRWILKPGSFGAAESAYLAFRFAFERLGLKMVYCRTVADNKKVVSFLDSCGIPEKLLLKHFFDLGGDGKKDAIEHRISQKNWIDISCKLEVLAEKVSTWYKGS